LGLTSLCAQTRKVAPLRGATLRVWEFCTVSDTKAQNINNSYHEQLIFIFLAPMALEI